MVRCSHLALPDCCITEVAVDADAGLGLLEDPMVLRTVTAASPLLSPGFTILDVSAAAIGAIGD